MSPELEVLALVDRIKPLLAGQERAYQGAALAELLSLWLAGHPPEVRESVLVAHIEAVRGLTRVNARALRGELWQ